jgi:hypothetical protein
VLNGLSVAAFYGDENFAAFSWDMNPNVDLSFLTCVSVRNQIGGANNGPRELVLLDACD